MARKGASISSDAGEPRRSSRIKDQVKPGPPSKKAPTKPRSRKPKPAEAEGDTGEDEKPKSPARGKKRTAAEKDADNTPPPPVNGDDTQPPAKKVGVFALYSTHELIA